ncbi:hypothetical protein Tsubulata_041290, partial [Turnera subulata]
MFFSQTFLARKGPLGSVWCAAHLQHRLTFSQYISTHIPSTVDFIMFPEVPFALRMSSHLLLGVVRIYSKKVECFLHDCVLVQTRLLKAFKSRDNTKAPKLDSVTLPPILDLDSLDYNFGVEDIMMETLPPERRDFTTEVNSKTGFHHDPGQVFTDTMDVEGPGPSIQEELPNERLGDHGSPEIMRDVIHENLRPPPPSPEFQNDEPKPTRSRDQVLNGEGSSPRILDDAPSSGEQSIPFKQRRSESPTSSALREASEPNNTKCNICADKQVRFSFDSYGYVLLVSNIRKALDDCGNILRKRRRKNSLSSPLGMWKLTNHLRKEQTFYQPLFTGSCSDICNPLQNFSTNSHLILDDEAVVQTGVASSAPETVVTPDLVDASSPVLATGKVTEGQNAASSDPATEDILESEAVVPPVPEPAIDMGVECLRHQESHADDFNPLNTFESETTAGRGTNIETGMMQTSNIAVSTRTYGSQMESPRTISEEFGADKGGLLDADELMNSAEADDLQAVRALVRCLAVAQYLKRHSPVTRNQEESSLSLDNILQGKTRKLCARMFYETLTAAATEQPWRGAGRTAGGGARRAGWKRGCDGRRAGGGGRGVRLLVSGLTAQRRRCEAACSSSGSVLLTAAWLTATANGSTGVRGGGDGWCRWCWCRLRVGGGVCFVSSAVGDGHG